MFLTSICPQPPPQIQSRGIQNGERKREGQASTICMFSAISPPPTPLKLRGWGGVTAESGYSSHSLLSPLPAQMPQTLPLSDRPQLSGCSPHPDPNSRPALLPHTPGEAIQRGGHTARFPLGPCWEEGCRGRTASYCPYFPLSPWLHLSPPALHTECAATGQERRTKVTGEPGTAPTPTHTANWAPHRGIVTPLV